MAQLRTNTFSAFVLSEQEEKTAINLPTTTLQFLYNLRAAYAEEKVQLTVDTTDINKFIQQEASLQGSISVLSYLIDLAENARQEEAESNAPPSPL